MELTKTNEMAPVWKSSKKFYCNLKSILFLNVSVFFLIKNVLVSRTSRVTGSHIRIKFLPVPDNRTEVLVHLASPQTSFGVHSSGIHFFRGGEMNARQTNP